MLIDCDKCEMRDVECSDCVVTALLGALTVKVSGHHRDPATAR